MSGAGRVVRIEASSTLTYQPQGGAVLKRLTIGIVTALAMLVAAGSAFAAIDTYSGGYSFSGKAGSKSRPAPLNFTQHFSLTAANPGSLTGILNKVTTSISGVKVDATGFPTCSASHVNSWNKASYASVCPKGSLVASGTIKAQLGTVVAVHAPGPQLRPEPRRLERRRRQADVLLRDDLVGAVPRRPDHDRPDAGVHRHLQAVGQQPARHDPGSERGHAHRAVPGLALQREPEVALDDLQGSSRHHLDRLQGQAALQLHVQRHGAEPAG